jgi:uncharacterized repeat protein (TIGR03803 family)
VGALAATMLPNTAHSAPRVETIFRFPSPYKTGDNPQSAPLVDASGAMYLAMKGGNTNRNRDLGTVVKLIPPAGGSTQWTSTLLHLFKGGADGERPSGGLAMDTNGDVFGSTSPSPDYGLGQVFELSPPTAGQTAWTKTVLWKGVAALVAPLLMGRDGRLYGGILTAINTGVSSIFSLTPPQAGSKKWKFDTLYTFGTGSDGSFPVAALVEDSAGNLYGTTEYGGSANLGTVFELTPPANGGSWSETQLYAFQGGTDGASPMASVSFGPDGSLYGTTLDGTINGGGSIFKLTPPQSGVAPWVETQILVCAIKVGVAPYDGVYVATSGNLYTTAAGRGKYGGGTVLKLTPPANGDSQWGVDVVYNFRTDNYYHPSFPIGGLTLGLNGLLYGTTSKGGPRNGGTAFSFAP